MVDVSKQRCDSIKIPKKVKSKRNENFSYMQ